MFLITTPPQRLYATSAPNGFNVQKLLILRAIGNQFWYQWRAGFTRWDFPHAAARL